MMPKVIYEPLRAAMKANEDSTAALGRGIGVSYKSILNKLAGITQFSITEARLLAEHYNCRIDDLFGCEQKSA